jgi:hypothetical protein
MAGRLARRPAGLGAAPPIPPSGRLYRLMSVKPCPAAHVPACPSSPRPAGPQPRSSPRRRTHRPRRQPPAAPPPPPPARRTARRPRRPSLRPPTRPSRGRAAPCPAAGCSPPGGPQWRPAGPQGPRPGAQGPAAPAPGGRGPSQGGARGRARARRGRRRPRVLTGSHPSEGSREGAGARARHAASRPAARVGARGRRLACANDLAQICAGRLHALCWVKTATPWPGPPMRPSCLVTWQRPCLRPWPHLQLQVKGHLQGVVNLPLGQRAERPHRVADSVGQQARQRRAAHRAEQRGRGDGRAVGLGLRRRGEGGRKGGREGAVGKNMWRPSMAS